MGQFVAVKREPALTKGRTIRIAAPPIVDEVQTPGEALHESDRDFAGSRLHYDFSKVRIHNDERAGRSKPPLAQTRFAAPGVLQAKLVVGPTDDPLEQQADRIGEQVIRLPDPHLSVAASPAQVSRKRTGCEEEEEDERKFPAKRSSSAETANGEAPAIVHEVLRSRVQPLGKPTPAFMETHLGHDFSRVRVRADARAAEADRAVQAHAYTQGEHAGDQVARGQRLKGFGSAPTSTNSQSIHRLLTPPETGRALPQPVRTSAERSLQWDFGAVRIHEDPQSGSDVSALGAVAVTHGHHIFLGMSAPPETSRAGWQLLLHELAHVRQQAVASSYGRLMSEPGDTHERAANAMSCAPVGDTNHASGDGPVAALQRQTPGPPPPVLPPGLSGPAGFDPSAFNWTRIPGEGFGGAAGDVVVGGARLGAGQFGTAVTPVAVTGSTTTVAEGTVVVGGSSIGEGAVVAGGNVVIGTAAAVGIVVIGALIVAGTILLVASLVPQGAKQPEAGEEYPGTSLPGGAPAPASAPGQDTPVPGQAPGTPGVGPAVAPGVPGRTPALVPGPASQAPVTEPRPVDTPAECAGLIKAGKTHDHHIFPWEYVNEFASIGIVVDDYTVTLNATEHIGSRGIHITMDWNGEWGDFFNEVPADLRPDQAYAWGRKAIEKAVELMNRAGIARKKIHRFRKPQSLPPLKPPKSKS